MYENIKSLTKKLAAHYTFRAEIPYERLRRLIRYYNMCVNLIQGELDKGVGYVCALPERVWGMPTPTDLNLFECYVNKYLGANLKVVYGITQTTHKNVHEFLIKFARLGIYELTYPRQHIYDDISWLKAFIDATTSSIVQYPEVVLGEEDQFFYTGDSLEALLKVYVPSDRDDTCQDYLLIKHGADIGYVQVYDCTQKGTPVWIYVPA